MRRPVHERHWKEEFKDLFAFQAHERVGLNLLLLFCAAASCWVVYEQAIAPDPQLDRTALHLAYAEMSAATSATTPSWKGRTTGVPNASRAEAALFAFDPNGLPAEQWMRLGLSERQAAAIHRYEERGGRFRTKADVARMRVVDPELFAAWRPFIQLPDSLQHSPTSAQHTVTWPDTDPGERATYTPRHDAAVEVNSADTTSLVDVKGIGPAFARGIVKYRDRLGGFHSLDQLGEVHILRDKPEAVAQLKERLLLDTLMVRLINVNTCTAEELGPHPYAGWKVAKALVAYRKQHGPFARLADVRNCALVTDSLFQRLVPYLTVE